MKSTDKHSIPLPALFADVRRLLKKYNCKLQIHQVRAQFMGAIASPVEQVNPMQELNALWEGNLPPIKSEAAARELVQVFVMGLWNQLTLHCDADNPFTLVAEDPAFTDKALKAWAQLRCEEIQFFLLGFFQGQNSLNLTPELCDGLDVLEDLVSMFDGLARMPKQKTPNEEADIRSLIDQLNQLVTIAENEINGIIEASMQDRRQDGSILPTVH